MRHCNLNDYDAFLVDVDGVLVRDSEVIPGAVEALAALQETGSVFIITNNSTRSRRGLAEHLAQLGFRIDASAIACTAYGAANWLAKQFGTVKVLPLGETGLTEELEAAGHRIAGDADSVAWIAAGMCRQLTYDLLSRALQALLAGAHLLACNHDPTYPAPQGLQPGAGAIVGALRGMGFDPVHTIGKPSPDLYALVAAQLGIEPSHMLMIGDRLDTDILGGKNYGADTLLVQSGVSRLEEMATLGITPTWTAQDLLQAAQGNARRLPELLPD